MGDEWIFFMNCGGEEVDTLGRGGGSIRRKRRQREKYAIIRNKRRKNSGYRG